MPEIFNYIVLIVCSDALLYKFWNISHYTSSPPDTMGSYICTTFALTNIEVAIHGNNYQKGLMHISIEVVKELLDFDITVTVRFCGWY